MKKTLSLIILSLFLTSTFPASVFSADKQDTAIITSISGKVECRLGKDGEWKEAAKRAQLPNMSAIRTGPGSRASVLFSNGSVIWLKPNSSFEIEAKTKDTQVNLNKGSIKVRVPHLKFREKFRIKTPTSIAAVRGTVFTADADDQSITGLEVLFGQVNLEQFGSEVKKAIYSIAQGNAYAAGKVKLLTTEQEAAGLEDWSPDIADSERRNLIAEKNAKRDEVRRFAQQAKITQQEIAVFRDQSKEEDFATGRTLVDVHGNLVRVDQRLDRPDSKTLQVVNIVKRKGYSASGLRKYEYGGPTGSRLDALMAKVEFNRELPANINELPGFLAGNENTVKVDNTQLVIANMSDTDSIFTIGYFGRRDTNSGRDNIESDLYIGTLTSGGGQNGRQKLLTLRMDAAKEVAGLTRFVENKSYARVENNGLNGELYNNTATAWRDAATGLTNVWTATENFVINNDGQVRNLADYTSGNTDFQSLLKNSAGQVVVFIKQDAGGTPSSTLDVTSGASFQGGNAARKNIDLVVTPDLLLSIIKTLATSGDSLKVTY